MVSVPTTLAPVDAAMYGTSARWSQWEWLTRTSSGRPTRSRTAASSVHSRVARSKAPAKSPVGKRVT